MEEQLLIIVQDRGWNLVALVHDDELDFTKWIAKKKAVIRLWGTENGLGQLAVNGPTPDTILDNEPAGSISKTYTLRTIECNKEKWEKWLDL